MTNEQLNEAVAERLGWELRPEPGLPQIKLYHDKDGGVWCPSDYRFAEDLDAAWVLTEGFNVSIKFEVLPRGVQVYVSFQQARTETLVVLDRGFDTFAEATENLPRLICLAYLQATQESEADDE